MKVKMWNVDLADTMREIAKEHIQLYKEDVNKDIEQLKTEGVSTYLWMCRKCGSWLLKESEAGVKDSSARSILTHYEEQGLASDILLYRLIVTWRNGQRVTGNIFSLDYEEYCRHIKEKEEGMVTYTVKVENTTSFDVEAPTEEEAINIACNQALTHDSFEANAKIISGYKREPVIEPLILKPEDWSKAGWETLCKLCGNLPPDRTQRMVLHVSEIESYIVFDQKREVTEWCPYCEREITLKWDTNTMGFEVFCPHCGKKIKLCDMCQHDETYNGICDYDADTESCFRRR